jgi:hypothetical protein
MNVFDDDRAEGARVTFISEDVLYEMFAGHN